MKHSVLSIILLQVMMKCVHASSGDREVHFQSCVEKCVTYRLQSKFGLPWQMTLLQWDNLSTCQYECMMDITMNRKRFGQPILQYFGKWPFIRFYGVQEPASALFSFLNCIAQILGWFHYRSAVSKRYEFYILTKIQCVVNVFGWSCATIFHTRDLYWTEKFDYFSAAGIIAISILVCFARIIGKLKDTRLYTCGVVLFLVFSHHIYYMAFIRFDYGYNMKFLMCIGAINIFIWLAWCTKHRTERPYVWKCALTMGSAFILAGLEIAHFAPFWFILDGHALWHMSTIPFSYIWYQFLIDDALFETRKNEKLP